MFKVGFLLSRTGQCGRKPIVHLEMNCKTTCVHLYTFSFPSCTLLRLNTQTHTHNWHYISVLGNFPPGYFFLYYSYQYWYCPSSFCFLRTGWTRDLFPSHSSCFRNNRICRKRICELNLHLEVFWSGQGALGYESSKSFQYSGKKLFGVE